MKSKKVQLIIVLIATISLFLNLVQLFIHSGASKKLNNFFNQRDTLFLKDTVYNNDTVKITQTISSSYTLGKQKLNSDQMLDSANSWLNSRNYYKALSGSYEKAFNTLKSKFDSTEKNRITLIKKYNSLIENYNDLFNKYSPKKYDQMESALQFIKKDYGITYKVERTSDSTQRYIFTQVNKVRTFDTIGYKKLLDSIQSSKRHRRRK